MVEVRFYHLQQKPLEQALPEILGKALEREYKIVIKASSREEVEAIDKFIWTYRADSFIPHGYKNNGLQAEQPIWITDKDENPNEANMLVLINATASEEIDNFELCCEVFDGNIQEVVSNSRTKWKDYKDKDYQLSYFQQDEMGRWQKKA